MKKHLVAKDLRPRLERARLELLALFRALDQLYLLPHEIPQALLRELFELDADFAEALWVLDQPLRRFDVEAMLRDTQASLRRLELKRARFLQALGQPELEEQCEIVATALVPSDAYLGVPGRDPNA